MDWRSKDPYGTLEPANAGSQKYVAEYGDGEENPGRSKNAAIEGSVFQTATSVVSTAMARHHQGLTLHSSQRVPRESRKSPPSVITTIETPSVCLMVYRMSEVEPTRRARVGRNLALR